MIQVITVKIILQNIVNCSAVPDLGYVGTFVCTMSLRHIQQYVILKELGVAIKGPDRVVK